MPRRLVFKSDCLYYQAMQPAISEGCKHKSKHRPKKHPNKTDDFKIGKTKPKRRNRMKKNEMKVIPEARH